MEVEPTILLPGSFNPIHKGHLSIAENVLRAMPEATLWFVVSPQNPLKSPSELAEERHRLQMARIAVGSSPLRERMTEPDSVSDERFTFLKDVPTIPVVATDIRARIRRGENPADDLPPGVWEYIKENGLYGYAR